MAVAEQLKYFNQFLAKSDGRDKLLATVQYVRVRAQTRGHRRGACQRSSLP